MRDNLNLVKEDTNIKLLKHQQIYKHPYAKNQAMNKQNRGGFRLCKPKETLRWISFAALQSY